MNLFSERMGIKPPKSVLQTESMDDDLRTGLWNALATCIWSRMGTKWISKHFHMSFLLSRLWRDHFKRPLDELGDFWPATFEEIKDYFFACEWYEVYDFLEFVARNYGDPTDEEVVGDFTDACNSVLKRELSAYRFVGSTIVPLTTEQEIAAVEGALAVPDSLSPVRSHLNSAVDLLADRVSPDYRNSIKESISAVEALSRLITGDSKATLGKALKKIDASVPLHDALRKAFGNLYGYSSDADGIRHSLMDESTLDFEDAMFMLVSCSAFVNYLVEKASKAGIEF